MGITIATNYINTSHFFIKEVSDYQIGLRILYIHCWLNYKKKYYQAPKLFSVAGEHEEISDLQVLTLLR